MICPKCGIEQRDGDRYCRNCGCSLSDENNQQKRVNYGENNGDQEVNYSEDNQDQGVNYDINRPEQIINYGGSNQEERMSSNEALKKPKGNKVLIIVLSLVICVLIAAVIFLYKDKISKNDSGTKSTNSQVTENNNAAGKETQKTEEKDKEVKDKIKEVISANAKALMDEDIEEYLSAMILTNDEEAQTRRVMEKLFDIYDLKYTIEKQTVLTTDKGDAQVEVVQLTEKISGPDFKDNRTKAVHHLKLVDGEWKIFKSDIKNVEYINSDSSASSNNASTNEKQESTYENYKNSRYGFSIKYPANLEKVGESANGDGMTFISKDESVKLFVFGSNNVFNVTAKSAYEEDLKGAANAGYKTQSGNWYVISTTVNNKIIYTKVVVGPGSINTLVFEYPANQKQLYDDFLGKLNSYFQTPGIDESH